MSPWPVVVPILFMIAATATWLEKRITGRLDKILNKLDEIKESVQSLERN